MSKKIVKKLLLSGDKFIGLLRNYFGGGGGVKVVNNNYTLAEFLSQQAAQVAQSTLYGYMKTRAGTSYPRLFENPEMLVSINIAKWNLYIACLSDLAVYCGGLIKLQTNARDDVVRKLLSAAVATALHDGKPPKPHHQSFAKSVEKLHNRIQELNFDDLRDDESAFCESPAALVFWAPVVDEFKKRDAEILRNSIKFRWIETRRRARKILYAAAVVENI